MKGIGALLLAVAVAAGSGGCAGTAVAPGDLNVGQCVNHTPSTDANGDNTTINTLTDCAKPHDAEVFLVFTVSPGPSGYPGDETIGTLQQSRCDAAFATYVGKDSGLSTYTITTVRPDSTTWSQGVRTIACLLEDGLGGQLTGSAKGTKK